MCLNFLSVWFRVDSGLGQWFIAGWLKVGAKFYLKSVQDCRKFICLVGLDLGLFWVTPLFGIRFRVYLRLVENLNLASGLTFESRLQNR